MRYYPVNLDMQNRRCLVVGGGPVAARKVLKLLECGAMVTVVSPDVTKEILQLTDNRSITLKKRHFQSSDLNGMFLVIGATNNEDVNWRIHSDAERMGKLCNIADRPEVCNFILPSIVNRGDLIIAISTSGASPAYAKKLRQDLEKEFGEEYGKFLSLMGVIRKRLLMKSPEPETHKPTFEKLINKGLVEMIRDDKREDINRLLSKVLGKGYSFETLMEKEMTG
ncbi:bifunctional precorrin-2 dehydrogenase/sirohydrochlorin ferrochelatase [Desulfococcaceae bacterium HSG8]|nr:bifunctional precorrin-2 dehydrogenase/sirohydrochlorin ferrochelatase [Desulfococcaceae bacterium HSG8]